MKHTGRVLAGAVLAIAAAAAAGAQQGEAPFAPATREAVVKELSKAPPRPLRLPGRGRTGGAEDRAAGRGGSLRRPRAAAARRGPDPRPAGGGPRQAPARRRAPAPAAGGRGHPRAARSRAAAPDGPRQLRRPEGRDPARQRRLPRPALLPARLRRRGDGDCRHEPARQRERRDRRPEAQRRRGPDADPADQQLLLRQAHPPQQPLLARGRPHAAVLDARLRAGPADGRHTGVRADVGNHLLGEGRSSRTT